MPSRRDLKRVESQESDTDSDYSPKTIVKKRKKQMLAGTDSPTASDTDSGRKKRKRNYQEPDTVEEALEDGKKSKTDDEQLSYSELICQTHKLTNVDIDIPDEYLGDITYKQFNKLVRPIVTDANPKNSGLHVTSLVGAKWREFKELYGMDHVSEPPDLERVKNVAQPSPSASESDMKESMPTSPDSLVINESGGEVSDDDEYLDEESSNDLKLKMIRRGNKIFRAGDRKTSRQSKKTARQGIVNLDDINLDDVTRADEENNSNQDALPKKPSQKKRNGPRIKNTKDKKEKKKAAAAAAAAAAASRAGKRGSYGKKAVNTATLKKYKVIVPNDLSASGKIQEHSSRFVVLTEADLQFMTAMDSLEDHTVQSSSSSVPITSSNVPAINVARTVSSNVTNTNDSDVSSSVSYTQTKLVEQELWNAQLRAENLQVERNLLYSQTETVNLYKQYMELKVENQILKNNEMKRKMYGLPQQVVGPSKAVNANVFSVLDSAI